MYPITISVTQEPQILLAMRCSWHTAPPHQVCLPFAGRHCYHSDLAEYDLVKK